MGLLARVEQRASIENPSTSLSNPDSWLFTAWGAGTTESNVPVTQETALRFSAVWACTNVLSQDIAKLPLLTYRRLERGKERATEHPAYRLLKTKANPFMTAYTLRRTLQAHACTWGMGFAEIERNGAGDPVALWPLLPDRTEVRVMGGRKVVITRVNNSPVPIPAEDVLIVPGLGFDGIRAYSVISMARESIGRGMAAEKYGAGFFGHGARPGGVIKRKDTLSEQAQSRIRQNWNQMHEGISGAHRVAILDEAMEYQQIGLSPEDSQFLELSEFSVIDIARWFRVPPHKIQMLRDAHYNNVESENRNYVTDTLQGWLTNWEAEINCTLFTEEEQDDYFAEHSVEGMLRGNSQERAEFYRKMFDVAAFSPNDIREKENLDPVEGGDERFIPLNMVPLSQVDMLALPADVGADDTDEDEEQEANSVGPRERRSVAMRHRLQETHVSAIQAVAQRLVDEEAGEVRKIVQKTLNERGAPEFTEALGKFYAKFEDRVRELFLALIRSYGSAIRAVIADELGQLTDPDLEYDQFVSNYLERMARRHVRKSENQLVGVAREAEIGTEGEAIEARLVQWSETRAGKIARSEATRAMGAMSKAAYVSAGILALVWRTVGTSCPYCRALNGRVVGIHENFANAGEMIQPDEEGVEPMRVRQGFGHAPAHASCDCIVSPGYSLGG